MDATHHTHTHAHTMLPFRPRIESAKMKKKKKKKKEKKQDNSLLQLGSLGKACLYRGYPQSDISFPTDVLHKYRANNPLQFMVDYGRLFCGQIHSGFLVQIDLNTATKTQTKRVSSQQSTTCISRWLFQGRWLLTIVHILWVVQRKSLHSKCHTASAVVFPV